MISSLDLQDYKAALLSPGCGLFFARMIIHAYPAPMKHNILGQISSDQFMATYWQSRPLLIRQAIADFKTELTPETLAGLALENNIRSRIVSEHSTGSKWQCRFGPFNETDFTSLPKSSWTLLVQDVEKHLPEYVSILDHFSFLPRWRIDDLMVSYATDGGSVGPHTDHYDVFLLQASGRRRWQIQSNDVRADELLDNTDLQILKAFHSEQEWTLEPGDMLYLPPGIAHHGVALDDCMTFSIGFKAPSQNELLDAYTEYASCHFDSNRHFSDPAIPSSRRRGELDQDSLQQLQDLLREALNKNAMTKTIARLLTEPVETPALFEPHKHALKTFSNRLMAAELITLHPAVRGLYIRHNASVLCYINAREYAVNPGAAESMMKLIDDYKLAVTDIVPLLQDKDLIKALYALYQDGGLNID